MINTCQNNNITFIAHSPFGGIDNVQGRLAIENQEFLKPIAQDIGCSVLQIWLWTLAHTARNVVVIPGKDYQGLS